MKKRFEINPNNKKRMDELEAKIKDALGTPGIEVPMLQD